MSDPKPRNAEVATAEDPQLPPEEALEALRAIRAGEVDAVVVRVGQQDQILLLKGAEQAYQALFETLNEGAVTLVGEGTIAYANLRFAALCAAPLDEIRGAPLHRFVAPEDAPALAALFEEAKRGSSKGELRLATAGGGAVPVMISMRLVEAPRPIVTAVVTDLTPIKEAQAELQRANERLLEADRRKDEYIAMLAHELRNPLTPILDAAELLRVHLRGRPDVERYRSIIERQGRHLSRLLDDLLDASRVSQGTIALRKARVDLTSLVRIALDDAQAMMSERAHALVVALPGEPLWVEADPTRVVQILLNLLTNAARYTPRGGRVEVTVERRDGRGCVCVRDNGSGIDPELLPRLFEPLVQGRRSLDRPEGGLGVGLALVKRLVEMHGGTVRAESGGLNQGSVFSVELPLAGPSEAVEPAPPPSEPPPSAVQGGEQALRVLVIEDHVDVAEMMRDVLEAWGHEVRVALSAEDGIREASAFRPHVAMVDVGMPEIDGYEVARRLRPCGVRSPGDPRLVCVTGYGQAQDLQRAREAGFDDHLVKPPDQEILQNILDEEARRVGARLCA